MYQWVVVKWLKPNECHLFSLLHIMLCWVVFLRQLLYTIDLFLLLFLLSLLLWPLFDNFSTGVFFFTGAQIHILHQEQEQKSFFSHDTVIIVVEIYSHLNVTPIACESFSRLNLCSFIDQMASKEKKQSQTEYKRLCSCACANVQNARLVETVKKLDRLLKCCFQIRYAYDACIHFGPLEFKREVFIINNLINLYERLHMIAMHHHVVRIRFFVFYTHHSTHKYKRQIHHHHQILETVI